MQCGDFRDGTPDVNEQDPTHIFSTPGRYQVTLKATDQQNGYTCGYSKTLNIQKPIPFWKEVLPQ